MEPLPPVKEVEYRVIIGRAFDELSGVDFTTFTFETAKEFSSFRYEIAVRYKVTPGTLEFRVLGMTATRTMMPAFGTAKSILKLPHLPLGQYQMLLIKSDGTENLFTIELSKRGFQILPPVPRKRFIDVVIDPKACLPGGRITSTVSKTPPAPLIPRTIQKRQPPPPTPEELAILASLKTETPEERDAREERELFGGAKRAPKHELEEAEKEAEKETEKLAAQPAEAAKNGKAPKHTIDAGPKHVSEPGTRSPATKPIAEMPDAKKKVAAKHPAAKSAPAKPAVKPKTAAKAAAAKAKPHSNTKTGHKSVSKQTPKTKTNGKSAAKSGPSMKKGKVVVAKTGSKKTHKTTPAAKKPAAKKR